MFLGLAALIIIATVPFAAGRLSGLVNVTVRGWEILLAALLLQIVITDIVDNAAPKTLLAVEHLLTYGVAAAVLWMNRKLPGIPLLGLGAGLNAVVIALNSGTLPASPSALRAAGIDDIGQFSNSGVLAHPRLGFLGDTMATPSFLPFRNVISIGDLVILAGFFVLVHVACRSWVGNLLARIPRVYRPRPWLLPLRLTVD